MKKSINWLTLGSMILLFLVANVVSNIATNLIFGRKKPPAIIPHEDKTVGFVVPQDSETFEENVIEITNDELEIEREIQRRVQKRLFEIAEQKQENP